MYKPLQDSLITGCLEIIDSENAARGRSTSSIARNLWAKVFPKPRRCWLPTGCLVITFKDVNTTFTFSSLFSLFAYVIVFPSNMQKLLKVLHGALPKMSLFASDFNYLPDVKIPGERAPLVSTKV